MPLESDFRQSSLKRRGQWPFKNVIFCPMVHTFWRRECQIRLPNVLDLRLSFEPVLLSVFSFIVITRRISFSPFLLSFELLPPIFDLIIILK